MKFSVLMSVYCKEKAEYLIECFESLLNQTVKADEWVVVEDGPLTDELYNILDKYQSMYPGLLKRIKLNENVGLGQALKKGVIECSHEIIARMDTDDISVIDRFEKQLYYMLCNPEVDICGGHIKEFCGNIGEIKSERLVPLTDIEIKRYQKKRDGLNHVTVMFKKSSIIKSGNYQSCLLMEDTLLWINMIRSGCIFANLDEYLVYVRTGEDMFARRGGLEYYQKYHNARKLILKTGYISYFDYLFTIYIQFIVCILPNN